MSWQAIQGHDAVLERFRRARQRGRLAGSFLFVGPAGIGKCLFAFALAEALLCKGGKETSLDPCGHCESCRLFESARMGTEKQAEDSKPFVSPHPDLYYVAKPPDKSFIPLELLIGDKGHRGHAGLCYNISRTPFFGHRKVAILDDADFLNPEGANALLKTLEEPPPDSVLILIGTSTSKQLPTIRSRCQIVRFSPLPIRTAATLLLDEGTVSTLERGLLLAQRAGGSLRQARDLHDDAFEEIRGEFTKGLSGQSMNPVIFASRLNEFIEAAGKDAPVRRKRLRLLFNLAIDQFRDKLKKLETIDEKDRSEALRERRREEARFVTTRMEKTLDALEQIDRNVNLPYIVDAWCAGIDE